MSVCPQNKCRYYDKCHTRWVMEEKKHHIIKRCNTCKFEVRIPKPGNVEYCYDCETPTIETRLLGKWCSSCKKDVVFKVNIELDQLKQSKMVDASTQTRRGKKIQLIVKETQDEEDEEDVCCECKTDEDVEQCMECDKYLCIECDPNEMATYGEGHSCSTMCAPCGEAYEKQLKKEDVEYWNKVDYFVTCDICGRDWDKKHDHRLVGALCHSWAYQTRSFCCPSCIDDGKCECDDCGEPSDSEEE